MQSAKGDPMQAAARGGQEKEKSDENKFTHGDVLQGVMQEAGHLPVTQAEAAAIRSAEAKALGGPGPKGGLGAEAQAAADQNDAGYTLETPQTLRDVLKDAKHKLAHDKDVEQHEANEVIRTEKKHDPNFEEIKSGVGALEQRAATANNP